MIILQHTLITLFSALELERIKAAKSGKILSKAEINRIVDKTLEEIPYIIEADTLKTYYKDRALGHFEKNSDGTDTSYMHYPTDLKSVNSENIRCERYYKADGYRLCALGEETNIEKFMEVNADLPTSIFYGILKHLKQDKIFDEWIREDVGLDCSGRYESMHSPAETTRSNIGRYIFRKPIKNLNGKIVLDSTEILLDGSGARKKIAEIEQFGVYVLAAMLFKRYEITTDHLWFDNHVKPNLDRVYSEELANCTYKYMQMDKKLPQIDRKIQEHDWFDIEKDNGPIALDCFLEMYQNVIDAMIEIDSQRDGKGTNKYDEHPFFCE